MFRGGGPELKVEMTVDEWLMKSNLERFAAGFRNAGRLWVPPLMRQPPARSACPVWAQLKPLTRWRCSQTSSRCRT